MRIIAETLKSVEIGKPAGFANLTMYPLVSHAARRPAYATLDEALAEGWLEITEISSRGSVPELKLTNRGDRGVLMMDGEELIGAKQNRVLNLTVLAPAGQTLVIPVSCVEQGRWASRSVAFSGSPQAMYAAARRGKSRAVSRNLAEAGQRLADQGAIWDAIAQKSARLKSNSPTHAMADIYAQQGQRVDDYVSALTASDGQTGAMFAIGGQLIGFDLFEHPQVLQPLLPKLARSYALDALDAEGTDPAPPAEAARSFLEDVAVAPLSVYDAVGAGHDVRIDGPRVTGGALVLDDRVVHLSAFRKDRDDETGSAGGSWSGVIRASRRRRG